MKLASPIVHLTWLRAVVLCTLLALGVTACGGATTSTTDAIGPSAPKCVANAAASATTFSANGGTAEVKVDTERECQWTASTDAAWITVKPPSGQGPAAVQLSIARNDQGRARSAGLLVNDRRLDLSQEAAPCRIQLDGPAEHLTYEGATGTIKVSTLAGCGWTATAGAAWITLRNPVSGSGNGEVTFTTTRNEGPIRTGVIRVGAGEYTIVQDAVPSGPIPPPPAPLPGPAPSPGPAPPPSCTVDVDRTQASIGAAGGDVRVSVRIGQQCSWSASTQVPWISVAAGTTGTGPGEIRLRIAANGGAARTGAVDVSGVAVVVSQAAAAPAPEPDCTFGVSPARATFPASGGTGRVTVRTAGGCAWTAASQSGWIVLDSGSSGKGPGDVSYHADSSKQQSVRSGALLVAGIRVAVDQEGAAPPPPVCSVAVEGPQAAIAAGGDDLKIKVRAGAQCAWTVTSRVPWITVLGDASGSGNADVRLRVANNPGGPRRGTVDVADQTFAIDQKGDTTRAIDLKGRVEDMRGACPRLTFVVDRRTVQTTPDTRYSQASCGALRDGVKVKVTGLEQGDIVTAVAIDIND